MKKRKFKVGDRVRIKDTENIRSFLLAKKSIGKICILNQGNVSALNDSFRTTLFNDKYHCNYEIEDLELVKMKTNVIKLK